MEAILLLGRSPLFSYAALEGMGLLMYETDRRTGSGLVAGQSEVAQRAVDRWVAAGDAEVVYRRVERPWCRRAWWLFLSP